MAADAPALGDIAILAPRLVELAAAHLARCLVNAVKRLAADYARFLFSRLLGFLSHSLLVPKVGSAGLLALTLSQGHWIGRRLFMDVLMNSTALIVFGPTYALAPSGARRFR